MNKILRKYFYLWIIRIHTYCKMLALALFQNYYDVISTTELMISYVVKITFAHEGSKTNKKKLFIVYIVHNIVTI